MEKRERLYTPLAYQMGINTCMQNARNARHIWTFMHGFPQKTQANTENLEQKAFATNQFSVSSSLYNQTSQRKEFKMTTFDYFPLII